MKTIKKLALLAIACGIIFSINSCGDDNDSKDLIYPEISSEGISAIPNDCNEYLRGETIHFNYLFTDDTELGKFNIEVHNNFDHHTHSTSATDCPMDANKAPVKPWVYNKDFDIPAGQRKYNATVDIPIPADIDPGDYHFMIRLTDKAGWQQLKSVAIKIVE